MVFSNVAGQLGAEPGGRLHACRLAPLRGAEAGVQQRGDPGVFSVLTLPKSGTEFPIHSSPSKEVVT